MKNNNEQLENDVKELKVQVELLKNKRLYQQDYTNLSVKQRHVEAMIIFRGLAADRPNGKTEVLAYFSTDTATLNIWDGTAWKQEVLT